MSGAIYGMKCFLFVLQWPGTASAMETESLGRFISWVFKKYGAQWAHEKIYSTSLSLEKCKESHSEIHSQHPLGGLYQKKNR